MERREINDEMFRHSFLVDELTSEQISSWAKSPITKALMDYLGKDGIMFAMQYDNDRVMAHFGIPLDIKKAIEDKGDALTIDDCHGPYFIIKDCEALK